VASPRKGTVIDERYQLSEKIGTGGMADVWLAEDTELDRNVAIKILHDRFAQDKEFVERFQREAQSAAGLQHPNVVGIFDRGVFRETYFIAMEYVPQGHGQGWNGDQGGGRLHPPDPERGPVRPSQGHRPS
jgi:eukaryotic-like serine/threonine-protein kinase